MSEKDYEPLTQEDWDELEEERQRRKEEDEHYGDYSDQSEEE